MVKSKTREQGMSQLYFLKKPDFFPFQTIIVPLIILNAKYFVADENLSETETGFGSMRASLLCYELATGELTVHYHVNENLPHFHNVQ